LLFINIDGISESSDVICLVGD